jgi:7-carboxy-7-deazaguanine synthase
MEPSAQKLRVTEIYLSVQGESTHVGKPCLFVRLTGCNLRCTWCDSTFTFTGGGWRALDDVVAEVLANPVRTVEITGGEPLLQKTAIPLMARLVAAGREVLLETSGSLSIADVPPAVCVILDLKPPDSGESEKNDWSNLAHLRPHHEVKFVIASRRDYEWARDVTRARDLAARCAAVLFSPAWGLVEPRDLVAWILEDQLPVRFQLQVHKVIWPPDARGV